MTTPLIITDDAQLREHLEKLCAAAGVLPEVATDPARALALWSQAPLVMVGADRLAALTLVAPPRRRGVYLVSCDHVADTSLRDALALGVESVGEFPRSDAWLMELLADADGAVPESLTIGVIAGSGGAGATTFACALADQAARGGDTALLDVDVFGPGIDLVLGTQSLDGLRWDGLGHATGRLSARAFRESLPRRGQLGVLTWGKGRAVAAFAVREAMSAATRGHETVVVDLPRVLDTPAEELAARCQHLVVVVRADVAGVASAARVVERLRDSGPVLLLVRGTQVEADSVGLALHAPVVAVMPDQRGLTEAVDLGLGPIRNQRCVLARAARATLSAVAEPHRGQRRVA